MSSYRELLLPREHGVWGHLAGAALVGLPLGGNLAGLPLLVAGICGVLLRQAVLSGQPWPRRLPVILLLATVASGLTVWTWMSATDTAWAWWLGVAVLLGTPCLRPIPSRPWWGSALAAMPAGLLASAIASAGGAGALMSGLAGGCLAMHLIAIVPLVRAQTRSDPRWPPLAIELHIIMLLIAIGLWSTGFVALGIPLLFGLGLARTAWLVDKRTPVSASPASIGLREMAWLPVVAAGVAFGLRGGAC